MKKTKAHNNFQEDAWLIFQDAWSCWYCGANTADCLHHIVGRGKGESKTESSILNAAPLCNHKCHLPHHGELRTAEWVNRLLIKTLNYIQISGYIMKQVDLDFLLKYRDLY